MGQRKTDGAKRPTKEQEDTIAPAAYTAEEVCDMLKGLAEIGIITQGERATFLCRLFERTRDAFAEAGDKDRAMRLDNDLKHILKLRDSLNDEANGKD